MNPDRLLDGRLKLRHLTLVTTIARAGSLSRTAEMLHVTQPVVSRSLQEMESILGVELFARGPRGVTATPAGEILVEHAYQVLGSLRAMGGRLHALETNGLDPVRVGTNLAGAHALLPRAIVRLKLDHPGLTVSVVEASGEELLSALRRDDVDLVLGRLQGDEIDGVPLRNIRLYEEPVRLVVRAGHPATEAGRLEIQDLMEYPWVLPGSGVLRTELADLFRARGLPAPHNLIECSTILTVDAILRESDAIAPLPLFIGATTADLAVLDTPLETVPGAIGVTLLRGRQPQHGARALLRYLRQVGDDLRSEATTYAMPGRA